MAAPIKTILFSVLLISLLWLGATLLSCAVAFGINAGELDIGPESRSDPHALELARAPLQRAADLAVRCFIPVPLLASAVLLGSGWLTRWRWPNIVIRFALLVIVSIVLCFALCFAAIVSGHRPIEHWLLKTANPTRPIS